MKRQISLIVILVLLMLAFGLASYFLVLKSNNPLTLENTENVSGSPVTTTRDPISPDTIPALAATISTGSDLKLIKVFDENDFYTRHAITYQSEGFLVSGILIIPKGEGPFPVLVLNHGYVDPETYQSGEGLKREQDFFAKNGYAILYSDYRNLALSEFDTEYEIRPRSGLVEDVLNLISAAKEAHLPELDMQNMSMLGFSLGGGVTENIMVAKPDTAQAYVLFAPIHSDYRVTFEKWVVPEWPEVAKEFYKRYGTPEDNPKFWHDVSASNFLTNVTAPVVIHQGTSDGEVPVAWSREFAERLEKAGKAVTYFEYPGGPHILRTADQNLAMQRSLEFLDANVKK